jgi:hypothetical protein
MIARKEAGEHNLISTWPARRRLRRLVISRKRGGTAMAHPNEDLLRRGYEAFGAGDIDTVLGIFDHGIVWHVGALKRSCHGSV